MLKRLGGLAARPLRRRSRPTPGGQREIDELLSLARESFVQVQDAWDRADVGALAALATAPLLEELEASTQRAAMLYGLIRNFTR